MKKSRHCNNVQEDSTKYPLLDYFRTFCSSKSSTKGQVFLMTNTMMAWKFPHFIQRKTSWDLQWISIAMNVNEHFLETNDVKYLVSRLRDTGWRTRWGGVDCGNLSLTGNLPDSTDLMARCARMRYVLLKVPLLSTTTLALLLVLININLSS